MSTLLKKADLPFLFDKKHVSFSGGWSWDEQPYWGQVGEVVGLIPANVKIDVPHDQKSTEYWFYFAAVSRYISYAVTMNGEIGSPEGFAQVCNKLTDQLMKGSIENGTPVSMLLSEYELNEAHRQPNLSDFYVFEYKSAAEAGKVFLERQQAHKWIMNHVNMQLNEKAMCERCGKHEYNMTAYFNNEELGKGEEKLCQGCFEEATAIESAWAFSDWYKHTQQEQWSVNSKLTDSLKDGYEAYCKGENVLPYWDTAETTDEALEVGDFVEVTIPFYWYSDERYEIGTRFVIKEQHISHAFEKWVKKVS